MPFVLQDGRSGTSANSEDSGEGESQVRGGGGKSGATLIKLYRKVICHVAEPEPGHFGRNRFKASAPAPA